MKAIKQIITLLNRYLVAREHESAAQQEKELMRDKILGMLPPTETNEWLIEWWGKVTYKAPKDSLVVDMEKLEKFYPDAYNACVKPKRNSPRFLVFPETEAWVEALKGVRNETRVQTASKSHP